MSFFLQWLFDIVIISGATRDLSQGENLAKRDNWPTLRKKLEVMENLDVDGYTETLNHLKIMRKMQKKQQPTENQNNTQTEI